MRGAGAARPESAVGSGERAASTSGHDGRYGDWRDFGGSPVVLRLPRGYLVVLAAALLLAIVLAYAVGHSQGYRRAEDVAKEKAQQDFKQALNAPTPDLINPNQPALTGGSSTLRRPDPNAVAKPPVSPGSPVNPGNSAVSPTTVVPAEPRYLQLARYPEKDANRLVAFLKKHGVEAAVIPTDNARLFLVVDQTAFDARDIRNRTAEYNQHREKLRQLGRMWKEKEKGPTDLADMTPQALPNR